MSQNIYYVLPFVLMAIVILFYLITPIVRGRKIKAFIAAHPDACLVKLRIRQWLIYYETIKLNCIDGGSPMMSGDGFFRSGFCALPGKHVLNVSFEKQRPGFFSKRVTTYYDPVNIEVTMEPHRNYILCFNKSEEKFELREA